MNRGVGSTVEDPDRGRVKGENVGRRLSCDAIRSLR